MLSVYEEYLLVYFILMDPVIRAFPRLFGPNRPGSITISPRQARAFLGPKPWLKSPGLIRAHSFFITNLLVRSRARILDVMFLTIKCSYVTETIIILE
jgi:hypothetical protein